MEEPRRGRLAPLPLGTSIQASRYLTGCPVTSAWTYAQADVPETRPREDFSERPANRKRLVCHVVRIECFHPCELLGTVVICFVTCLLKINKCLGHVDQGLRKILAQMGRMICRGGVSALIRLRYGPHFSVNKCTCHAIAESPAVIPGKHSKYCFIDQQVKQRII